MTVVALTGGIAAGKTTVTDVFRAEGLNVVDADELSREAIAPGTPALSALVDRFGPGVLREDGSLNRDGLAAIVFGNDQALAALNAMVHPEVWRLSKERFEALEKDHPQTPLVYAVPLLAESDRVGEFDAVIVVDAPAEQRVSRLVESRQMSPEEARSRVSSQAPDEDRLDIADVILDASVSEEQTTIAARSLAGALKACWPDRLATLPTRF